MNYFICSDISGTHSTFSLFERDKIFLKERFREVYFTKEFKSFLDLIKDFLNKIRVFDINYLETECIFSAAGEIKQNFVKLTNANLEIDSHIIKKEFGFGNVALMNDYSAIAYFTLDTSKGEIIVINKGKSIGKKRLIVGAGTGLGCCILDGKKVIETQEGHREFICENEFDLEIKNFLEKTYNLRRVEFEDLVSGRGIERIYYFLSKEKKNAEEISKLSKVGGFFETKSMNVFYSYFIRFIRWACLEYMTQNGIYVAGGVIQKNMPSKNFFNKEFVDSNNHKNFLADIPIYIIKNYDCSIYGLANYICLKEGLKFK